MPIVNDYGALGAGALGSLAAQGGYGSQFVPQLANYYQQERMQRRGLMADRMNLLTRLQAQQQEQQQAQQAQQQSQMASMAENRLLQGNATQQRGYDRLMDVGRLNQQNQQFQQSQRARTQSEQDQFNFRREQRDFENSPEFRQQQIDDRRALQDELDQSRYRLGEQSGQDDYMRQWWGKNGGQLQPESAKPIRDIQAKRRAIIDNKQLDPQQRAQALAQNFQKWQQAVGGATKQPTTEETIKSKVHWQPDPADPTGQRKVPFTIDQNGVPRVVGGWKDGERQDEINNDAQRKLRAEYVKEQERRYKSGPTDPLTGNPRTVSPEQYKQWDDEARIKFPGKTDASVQSSGHLFGVPLPDILGQAGQPGQPQGGAPQGQPQPGAPEPQPQPGEPQLSPQSTAAIVASDPSRKLAHSGMSEREAVQFVAMVHRTLPTDPILEEAVNGLSALENPVIAKTPAATRAIGELQKLLRPHIGTILPQEVQDRAMNLMLTATLGYSKFPQNKQDLASIPSGVTYIAPDGTTRRKR